jgi:collagenase-like PrtC family protease
MNIESDRCRLAFWPLLFSWLADRWSDFYARIADEAPVDRVCLGEVVCSRRLAFYGDRLPAAIERLQRSGKTVVLSSLALAAAGLVSLRLSLHRCDVVAVATPYRRALDAALDAKEVRAVLAALLPGVAFSNGFLHGPCGTASQRAS